MCVTEEQGCAGKKGGKVNVCECEKGGCWWVEVGVLGENGDVRCGVMKWWVGRRQQGEFWERGCIGGWVGRCWLMCLVIDVVVA